MLRWRFLKAFSIVAAIVVGVYLPLRAIGFFPSFALDVAVYLLVPVLSLISLVLHFYEMANEAQGHAQSQSLRARIVSLSRLASSWMSVGVICDVMCVLPIALGCLLVSGRVPLPVLLVNLLAVRHVRRIKPLLDDIGSLGPVAYRLVPLVMMLPLLVHMAACAWIALGAGSAGLTDDPFTTYAKGFYWAFSTLTTVGYGDIVAVTPVQMFYACLVQFIGVGIFGYILSNVASLLSRSDAAREHHMDSLDRIETFMTTHATPPALRLKIRDYYRYLWKNKKGYQDRSLLDGLPSKIQSELFMHINRLIIEKVPLFKGASEDMLADLMNELESPIFIPSERVFKIDEHGDALYFIQSGSVEIVGRDGRVIVVLQDGAFFGEMALVSDQPRNASAVAIGFCDLYVLHRSAFERVVSAYPKFREHIQETVDRRQAA